MSLAMQEINHLALHSVLFELSNEVITKASILERRLNLYHQAPNGHTSLYKNNTADSSL